MFDSKYLFSMICNTLRSSQKTVCYGKDRVIIKLPQTHDTFLLGSTLTVSIAANVQLFAIQLHQPSSSDRSLALSAPLIPRPSLWLSPCSGSPLAVPSGVRRHHLHPLHSLEPFKNRPLTPSRSHTFVSNLSAHLHPPPPILRVPPKSSIHGLSRSIRCSSRPTRPRPTFHHSRRRDLFDCRLSRPHRVFGIRGSAAADAG